MFKQIKKKEFSELLENPQYTLVDVRTDGEREKYGQIRDDQLTVEYSMLFFKSKLSKLDLNKKYLVYCAAWKRSENTRNTMQQMWFDWVCDLEWGMHEWIKD